jgi:hypothetical protein
MRQRLKLPVSQSLISASYIKQLLKVLLALVDALRVLHAKLILGIHDYHIYMAGQICKVLYIHLREHCLTCYSEKI